MSSDGMRFYYGSYEHPPGEVYPRSIEVRPAHTEDGIRWASHYRMQVAGDFCYGAHQVFGPTQISDRITSLEAAYLEDYKDCGFKLSDGTETPHKLITNAEDNLSGNKIVHRSWDHATPVEYASTRSFAITIEALFRESYNDILHFREQVTRTGTGGPTFRTFNLFNGLPFKEIVTQQSRILHVQQGTIIGLNNWPQPPPPYWPEEEQQWRQTVTQHSPHFHGDLTFQKGTHFRVDYTYYFERPGVTPLDALRWFNG